jgi:hypothetical protein
MSGIPTKRPPKPELQLRIDTGMTRQEMAETYDVHITTLTKWFVYYGIINPGGYGKVKDVECGMATVVALITEEGEPEKYAIPGGSFCHTRDEAIWVAAAMSILMGGRVNHA